MYDVLVKSTLFGLRNADKVINTNDKGKILADVGQLTNAAKTAAQLDNALGKGAQAAIQAMGNVSRDSKALQIAAKGANWASNHVNPLLVGAAGYRVLIADDKETALKREIFGMSSMFAVEGLMKAGLKSQYFQNARGMLKHKNARMLLAILEGIVFVAGSIAGSTAGYKIGSFFYPDKDKKETGLKLSIDELKASTKNADIKNINKADSSDVSKIDEIDDSEYFALTPNKKTLA